MPIDRAANRGATYRSSTRNICPLKFARLRYYFTDKVEHLFFPMSNGIILREKIEGTNWELFRYAR